MRDLRKETVFLLLPFFFLGVLYYPVISHLVVDWWTDPNYSHGFLMPLVAGYFIWQKRDEIRLEKDCPSWLGLGLVLGGAILLILGRVIGELYVQRVSFLMSLYGSVFFLLGRQVARILLFPFLLLLLAIPIPYVIYNSLTFPLKLLASKMAAWSLGAIGIPTLREGNIIYLPNMVLEVADACSGIRSIISLLAMTVILAYFVSGWGLRLVLVASAIPIAIFTNALRIVGTGILSYHFGQKAAQGFFHYFSGWLVFLLSLAILGGILFLARGRR
ncbi:exosortase/archaeosortase family protein [Thermosulfuriphilus sp.]